MQTINNNISNVDEGTLTQHRLAINRGYAFVHRYICMHVHSSSRMASPLIILCPRKIFVGYVRVCNRSYQSVLLSFHGFCVRIDVFAQTIIVDCH